MLLPLNVLCVLITLNCFAISFACIAPVNARIYGLLAFLLMVGLNAGSIFRLISQHPIRFGLRILGILICSCVILATNRPYVWCMWYVPLLYLFFDVSHPPRESRSQKYLVWTAFVFAFCYALSFHSSHVWYLLQVFSTQVSRVLGQLTGTQVVLGTTGSGFWVFFSCLLCLFFAYRLHGRKDSSQRTAFAIATGYLCLGYFVYTAYGQSLFQNLYRTVASPLGLTELKGSATSNFAATSMNSPLLFLALAVGVTIVFVPKLLAPNVQGTSQRPRQQIKICTISAGVALIATLLFYLPPTDGKFLTRHITFYGKGLVTWDTPQRGRYGTISSGMFGLLPQYLQSTGYQTFVLEKDVTVKSNILEDTQVFVVINLNVQFSEDERTKIWNYVKKGGSLLVLGDHTDLEGTMNPLNHLLEPVNIKFRFDSAFTATHWFNAYALFPHPITSTLDYSNDTLQHSTGASLDIAPPAVPIVNAKFAFSDKGNYANENGYLGDYLYQPGEHFSDLVVVAGATYGKGKVVVFGDTSGFQNLPIYHSHEFINSIFSYLTLPISPQLFQWGGLVLLLGLLFAHLFFPSARTALAIPLLAVTLGTGLFIGHYLLPLSAPTRPHTRNIAYVDAAHINQYSLTHWKEDSINGLTLNLARNGYLPMIRRSRLDNSIFSAKIYVVIAPHKSFTSRELELLKTYMNQGGLFILAVGWEEKAGSQKLLDLLEVDIIPIPLGPVPLHDPTLDDELIEAIQREPHFMEAWPISYQSTSHLSVLYGFGDYPIVVYKSFGNGGAIVIADTQFLYNRTLEAEKAWWEGNIIFFKQLLEFGQSGVVQK